MSVVLFAAGLAVVVGLALWWLLIMRETDDTDSQLSVQDILARLAVEQRSGYAEPHTRHVQVGAPPRRSAEKAEADEINPAAA